MENRAVSTRFTFTLCFLLTQALGLHTAWALPAASTSWAVGTVQQLGEGSVLGGFATASGDVYTFSPCASATQYCVLKYDSSGRQIYSVAMPVSVSGMAADSTGNLYVTGWYSTFGGQRYGFQPSPGAYESTPPSANSGFVCKLTATDGHAIFCTFVDVYLSPLRQLSVDAQGNSYFAGLCANVGLCVEKINADGTGLVFRTILPSNSIQSPVTPAFQSFDSAGNLVVAQRDVGVVKLSPAGAILATTSPFEKSLVAFALTPQDQPQVMLQNTTGVSGLNIIRYTVDFAHVVWQEPFLTGLAPAVSPGMAIDSSGITDIWGSSSLVNLPAIHPTSACLLNTTGIPFLARLNQTGDLLQLTPLNMPPDAISPIAISSASATLLIHSYGNWQIATLGPADSETIASCIGNAASFRLAPVAPNEIVTLFGYGLTTGGPQIAQPDSSSHYPFQLNGEQVSFDGVAAPLLYASSGQINLIAPASIEGKTTTHLCVAASGTTGCMDVPVAPTTPGVFLADAAGHAAAINQDGTINSAQNPAMIGSVVSIYLTGLGTVSPAVPDGAITPIPIPNLNAPPTITMSWQVSPSNQVSLNAQILYAGPAPLEVEGLDQINLVVPAPPNFGQPSGGPLITVASQISNLLIPSTIWVK